MVEVLTSCWARSLTLHGEFACLDHQACHSMTLAAECFKILIQRSGHSPVLVEDLSGCVHISCYDHAGDDDFDHGEVNDDQTM